ncbi:MAG TPA: hypothetical protein VF954_05380 [Acidimicrobiales bacterium]
MVSPHISAVGADVEEDPRMTDWHRSGDSSDPLRSSRRTRPPGSAPDAARQASALLARLAPGDRDQHLAQADMARLQHIAGNAAVSSLLERAPVTVDADGATTATVGAATTAAEEHVLPAPTLSFTATIKRADRDAVPGSEDTSELSGDDVVGTAGGEASDIQEGQTASLPDIETPEDLALDTDAVDGSLTYAPSVAQSGTVSPFGSTTWSKFNITGISVTASSGTFKVSATVQNPITFNVDGGGDTDIASDSDSALTAANYATAASDLTPNMGDLGGRPPRTQFWAKDLTVRHENFHATERQTFGGQGVTAAQTWLASQTASSAADVQSLLTQVPGKVIAVSQAAMPYPAKEERAYGDGADAYKARADAITTKGAAGGYT